MLNLSSISYFSAYWVTAGDPNLNLALADLSCFESLRLLSDLPVLWWIRADMAVEGLVALLSSSLIVYLGFKGVT